ncbi:hypothetical protein C8R44DRAFT_746173 [Mycena epipterygia]|nr:hypothetical protein C8R44DRAFT_746173 [Mycena epipterygia]
MEKNMKMEQRMNEEWGWQRCSESRARVSEARHFPSGRAHVVPQQEYHMVGEGGGGRGGRNAMPASQPASKAKSTKKAKGTAQEAKKSKATAPDMTTSGPAVEESAPVWRSSRHSKDGLVIEPDMQDTEPPPQKKKKGKKKDTTSLIPPVVHALPSLPLPSSPPLSPPPPPLHDEEALWNLATHHQRNPEGTVQPPKPVRGKDKVKGTAESNTADLGHKQKKAAQAELVEAIRAFEVEAKARAAELTTTLGLPLEEVRMVLGHATKFKKKRAYNEFSAKILDREEGDRLKLNEVQEIVKVEPEDTWSQEDLDQLKLDFLTHKAAEEMGIQKSNTDAAKDVTHIGDRMFEELILLEHHTGAQGFCVLVGGNVNDTITPMVVGSPSSLAFIPAILKMDAGTLALKFQCYASLKDSMPPKDAVKRRLEVVEMIEASLHEKASGRGDLGVEFEGWPKGFDIKAPSKFGAGGSGAITTLWEWLTAGTCKFVPVDPEKCTAIQAKYKNFKHGTSKKEANDDNSSEELEVEEDEPKVKRTSGKRARVENDEEEPPRRKKKAVKFVEEEEEDDDGKDKKKKKVQRKVKATEGGEEPKKAVKHKSVREDAEVPLPKKTRATTNDNDAPEEDTPTVKKRAFAKRRKVTKTPEFVPTDVDEDVDVRSGGSGGSDDKAFAGDGGEKGKGSAEGKGKEGGNDKAGVANAVVRFNLLKKRQAASLEKAAIAKECMTHDLPLRRSTHKQPNAVAGPSKTKSLKDIDMESSKSGFVYDSQSSE